MAHAHDHPGHDHGGGGRHHAPARYRRPLAIGFTLNITDVAGGRFTDGPRRASILSALGNAIILLVVTGGIGWEAIRRLPEPAQVAGRLMMVVAALGILVNGGTALMFDPVAALPVSGVIVAGTWSLLRQPHGVTDLHALALKRRRGIGHPTLQIERGDGDACAQSLAGAV